MCGEEFCLVVPGIRPHGGNGDDQVRVLTPSAALDAGADYLVVGRPITGVRRSGRGGARHPARRALSAPAFVPACETAGRGRILRFVALLGPCVYSPGSSPPLTIEDAKERDMALPQLTPEQRADALKKAAAARKARAELKGELKSGKLTLEQVLKREDDTVGKMKVSVVLESLPGCRQGSRRQDHGGARHQREPSRAGSGGQAARAAERQVREVALRAGTLFVVAGPSGVGKGTVVRNVLLAHRRAAGPVRQRHHPRSTPVGGRGRRLLLRGRGRVRSDDRRRRTPRVGADRGASVGNTEELRRAAATRRQRRPPGDRRQGGRADPERWSPTPS